MSEFRSLIGQYVSGGTGCEKCGQLQREHLAAPPRALSAIYKVLLAQDEFLSDGQFSLLSPLFRSTTQASEKGVQSYGAAIMSDVELLRTFRAFCT